MFLQKNCFVSVRNIFQTHHKIFIFPNCLPVLLVYIKRRFIIHKTDTSFNKVKVSFTFTIGNNSFVIQYVSLIKSSILSSNKSQQYPILKKSLQCLNLVLKNPLVSSFCSQKKGCATLLKRRNCNTASLFLSIEHVCISEVKLWLQTRCEETAFSKVYCSFER